MRTYCALAYNYSESAPPANEYLYVPTRHCGVERVHAIKERRERHLARQIGT